MGSAVLLCVAKAIIQAVDDILCKRPAANGCSAPTSKTRCCLIYGRSKCMYNCRSHCRHTARDTLCRHPTASGCSAPRSATRYCSTYGRSNDRNNANVRRRHTADDTLCKHPAASGCNTLKSAMTHCLSYSRSNGKIRGCRKPSAPQTSALQKSASIISFCPYFLFRKINIFPSPLQIPSKQEAAP